MRSINILFLWSLNLNDEIDEVRRTTVVEQDRKYHISNIILYNVQEPTTDNWDERWQEYREFCLVFFNKILKVPVTEEDIKWFARLGKVNLAQQGTWATLSTRAHWQNLKADWIYSTKRMMTQSYGWKPQRLQHSRNEINEQGMTASAQERKVKPVLMQFRDSILKNVIMASVV